MGEEKKTMICLALNYVYCSHYKNDSKGLPWRLSVLDSVLPLRGSRFNLSTGTRSHMLQLKDLMCHNKRSCMPQLRLGAAK